MNIIQALKSYSNFEGCFKLIFFNIYLFLFIYLAVSGLSYGMQDLPWEQ